MFKYIYNTPNLDVTAGKSLSGWNISNHDQKIHGGISPTMRDGINCHATDDEAKSDMEKWIWYVAFYSRIQHYQVHRPVYFCLSFALLAGFCPCL